MIDAQRIAEITYFWLAVEVVTFANQDRNVTSVVNASCRVVGVRPETIPACYS